MNYDTISANVRLILNNPGSFAREIAKFFTAWTVILVLFHHYTHAHFHLLAITFVVAVVGTYLTHVNPKYFVMHIDDSKIVMTPPLSYYLNVLFHVVPFLFILFKYGPYYYKLINMKNMNRHAYYIMLLNTSVLVITYAILIDIPSRYNISPTERNYVLVCAGITIAALYG